MLSSADHEASPLLSGVDLRVCPVAKLTRPTDSSSNGEAAKHDHDSITKGEDTHSLLA